MSARTNESANEFIQPDKGASKVTDKIQSCAIMTQHGGSFLNRAQGLRVNVCECALWLDDWLDSLPGRWPRENGRSRADLRLMLRCSPQRHCLLALVPVVITASADVVMTVLYPRI